jgi:putative adenylate-forming enzyme
MQTKGRHATGGRRRDLEPGLDAPMKGAAVPAGARGRPWDPIQSTAAWWSWVGRMSETWWTRHGGAGAVDAARAERLTSLLDFVRERSPHYRDLWRPVPRNAPLEAFPVVTKRELMADFDRWVTDPQLTRAGVEAFLADRTRIGLRHLGRYAVWKSSGSSGEPGIFVQDGAALATYDALIGVQLGAAGLGRRYASGVFGGGKAALITARDDHYASIVSWERLQRASPWLSAKSFSVLDPLPDLVAALNAYQPAFIGSYPTMLVLLAEERAAGRLHIAPSLLWSGGEYMTMATRLAIESAFGCPVVNEYGASEALSIAYGCTEGWLHVNSDWVVLEPVDRNYQPTPPGEASHTVLLTNLANRVQPLVRYDLGDSITAKPLPCECGSPLPAIQVEGRRDDIVSLTGADGRVVRLLPLALSTVVEEAAGLHRFQILQTAADSLALRLDPDEAADPHAAWAAASRGLREYLARQSLANVTVALERHLPARSDPRSGKLRQVCVVCAEPRALH